MHNIINKVIVYLMSSNCLECLEQIYEQINVKQL
jgi:hypothetical protein